jgi:endogenous inhibitor of DNA gyrase (YacG/DUF329 family)
MAAIVVCPACQRTLKVPDVLRGREVRCPDCRHQFRADDDGADVAPPEVPPGPLPVPEEGLSDPEAAPPAPETETAPAAAQQPASVPCPFCGESIPSGARHCDFCGEDLAATTPGGRTTNTRSS